MARPSKSRWCRRTGDQAIQFNVEHRSADGFCGWCTRYRVAAVCRQKPVSIDSPPFGDWSLIGPTKMGNYQFHYYISVVNTAVIMTSVATEVKIETPPVSSPLQVRPGPSGRAAVKPCWSRGSADTPLWFDAEHRSLVYFGRHRVRPGASFDWDFRVWKQPN